MLIQKKLSPVNHIGPVTVVVREAIDGIRRMAFFICSDRASFTSLRPVNEAEELKRDVNGAEEVPGTKNY